MPESLTECAHTYIVENWYEPNAWSPVDFKAWSKDDEPNSPFKAKLEDKIADSEESEYQSIIASLEIAATEGNERAFLSALKGIEWDDRPVSDFVKIIHLALKAGAHLAARQVSIEGAQRYPDNPDIQKYARGLAPPRVIARDLPPNPTLRANREWLKTHSETYRGQWVAIRDGQLLATASSLKELTKQIPERENILFTKVR